MTNQAYVFTKVCLTRWILNCVASLLYHLYLKIQEGTIKKGHKHTVCLFVHKKFSSNLRRIWYNDINKDYIGLGLLWVLRGTRALWAILFVRSYVCQHHLCGRCVIWSHRYMGLIRIWICIVKSDVFIVWDRHSFRTLVANPAGVVNRLLYYPQEKVNLPGRNDRQRPLTSLGLLCPFWGTKISSLHVY